MSERTRPAPGPRDAACQAFTWLLITLFVAAVAVATVAASAALGAHGRPPVVSLLVAAAVVATAMPRVRRAAERAARRLLLGDRADAYQLVSDFVRSSASTLPIEEVLPRLAETAARTVRSPRGEVRVWLSDGGEWREAWPVSRPEGSVAVNVGVLHEGRAIGELEVTVGDAEGDATGARRRLGALAGPAGLALSTVRLTVELRQRLEELARIEAELQASGRRLVEARLDERQRFVTTIDRFVRPHLTAADAALRAAASAAGAPGSVPDVVGAFGAPTRAQSPNEGAAPDVDEGAAPDVDAQLVVAGRHGEAALESLRSLAHGVFPLLLLQGGLGDALANWADESDLALEVHNTMRTSFARQSPTAAAVLYFVCVEALGELRPAPPRASVELAELAGDATLLLRWTSVEPHSEHPTPRLDPAAIPRLADRIEALGGRIAVRPDELRLAVPVAASAQPWAPAARDTSLGQQRD